VAVNLDRQVRLILLGPRTGNTYGAPTLTRAWGRLLEYNVDSDPTQAGVIPSGAAKVMVRYRGELAGRISFPGTWTPSTDEETAEWAAFTDTSGNIRDSFVVDRILYNLSSVEQAPRAERRRYIILFGEAVGTVGGSE